MNTKAVFIVDDSPEIIGQLIRLLEREQFSVAGVAGDVKSAKEWLSLNSAGCIILDIGLPDGSGFDLLEWYEGKKQDTTLIVFTNYYSEMIREKSLLLGADYVFDKSDDVTGLLSILEKHTSGHTR
ncbi:MAG: response regulator [Ignavibacteriales bacterium]|nr:MAG: response regulator [Ignavibacteriales bacterium]